MILKIGHELISVVKHNYSSAGLRSADWRVVVVFLLDKALGDLCQIDLKVLINSEGRIVSPLNVLNSSRHTFNYTSWLLVVCQVG